MKTMDARTTLRLDFSEYPGAEVEFSIPVSAFRLVRALRQDRLIAEAVHPAPEQE